MVELVEADIEQFYQGRRRMPYIAPWSEEQPDRSLTWLSGGRLAYTDEVQQDRVQRLRAERKRPPRSAADGCAPGRDRAGVHRERHDRAWRARFHRPGRGVRRIQERAAQRACPLHQEELLVYRKGVGTYVPHPSEGPERGSYVR